MNRSRKPSFLGRLVLLSPMLLLAQASAQMPQPFTISFTQGQEMCQVLHFPEQWITEPPPKMKPRDAALYKFLYEEDAVFRRTADMGPGQVLVSVESLGSRKSLLKYLLDLDASPVIREIGGAVWSSAAQLNITGDLWAKLAGQGLTIETSEDPAHLTPFKMQETRSSVSPSHEWAAVYRWHGVLRRGEEGVASKMLAPEVVPFINDYSIEIANAATEEKIVIARGRFRGVSTTHLSRSFGWVTDRIFWMPLDNEIRHVLVCDAMRFQR